MLAGLAAFAAAVVLAGLLAFATAATFTGAAVIINLGEQPARLAINDDRAMLTQWARSYSGAAPMQSGLAIASCLFGLIVFWVTRDWRWLAGALLMIANWPYTLLFIKPVNDRLHAMAEGAPLVDARASVERWGDLHAGRSALGCVATLVYLWAMM